LPKIELQKEDTNAEILFMCL